jgi:hypothetical protein
MSLLELKNISRQFGAIHAVDHSDLTAAWKQCVSPFIDDIGSGHPLPRGDNAPAVHEIIDQVYQRS